MRDRPSRPARDPMSSSQAPKQPGKKNYFRRSHNNDSDSEPEYRPNDREWQLRVVGSGSRRGRRPGTGLGCFEHIIIYILAAFCGILSVRLFGNPILDARERRAYEARSTSRASRSEILFTTTPICSASSDVVSTCPSSTSEILFITSPTSIIDSAESCVAEVSCRGTNEDTSVTTPDVDAVLTEIQVLDLPVATDRATENTGLEMLVEIRKGAFTVAKIDIPLAKEEELEPWKEEFREMCINAGILEEELDVLCVR